MIAQLQTTAYTPAEYLALEEKAEFRHEYINGEIIPMTGGTVNHNIIAGNLYISLSIALRGKIYTVFFSDLRLWIPEKRIYTYPDVMVVAGDLAFHEDRNDTITNPVVIIEVLSKSTSSYDRGEKFNSYRTIPTLQEYMLVEQDKIEVSLFRKIAENKWELQIGESLQESLSLSSIPVTLCLTDIYEKVEFIAI